MFARFRNLFSKSKSETETESDSVEESEVEIDEVQENGSAKLNLKQKIKIEMPIFKTIGEIRAEKAKINDAAVTAENYTPETQTVAKEIEAIIENMKSFGSTSDLEAQEDDITPVCSRKVRTESTIDRKDEQMVIETVENRIKQKIATEAAVNEKEETFTVSVEDKMEQEVPTKFSEIKMEQEIPTKTAHNENEHEGLAESIVDKTEQEENTFEKDLINGKTESANKEQNVLEIGEENSEIIQSNENKTVSVELKDEISQNIIENIAETSFKENIATKVPKDIVLDSQEHEIFTTNVTSNITETITSIPVIDISITETNTSIPDIENLLDTVTSENSQINNNNSSIVVEDLATDTVPSSVADKNNEQSNSESNASPTTESSTIVVNPIDNNAIACTAISNKLKEISEVAESLDAAIRDVQITDTDALETNSSSSGEKKLEHMRSNSSEDWHSRSTEDESFATASEGNFTPHSHSSSFQTASGRTSSYISSSKTSFDASEADDSTFPVYEIPVNMLSFDDPEHSFLSAQNAASVGASTAHVVVENEDDYSVDDIEELHSQSVTPTPGDSHFESIPVESETELESCIADAPSMEILTEVALLPSSVTPEVSSTCSNSSQLQQNQQQNTNNSNNKPNAAWRRSKYYENITKQTIKGFL